jgi:hypothetical protein
MSRADLLRYALWLAVVATARANRRHYRMPTTWLPHLALNTAALLLPDLLRLLKASRPQGDPAPPATTAGAVRAAVVEVVAHNRAYGLYVMPFSTGYLLSHPRFDIYKGPLGELRLAGFGLDAAPHAATALALTLLAGDTLRAAAGQVCSGGPLARLLCWAARRRALSTGTLLALLTLVWESGEWLALRYELDRRGDPALTNMRWSVPDALRDCAANAAGWALACVLRDHEGTKTRGHEGLKDTA